MNSLMNLKNTIDFKTMPASLMNLKRAIYVFFLILIATSVAILSVSIKSNHDFDIESESVRKSITILKDLADIRLSFRLLI